MEPKAKNGKPAKLERAKTAKRVHENRGLLADTLGSVGDSFNPIAGKLGRAAGSIVSKIIGWGDYRVNHNSMMRGNQYVRVSSTVPTFSNDADGVRITHRELVSTVRGSELFNNTLRFGLNPGAEQFRWLRGASRMFDTYRWNGLVFEYRPTSGPIAVGSPALGVVLMATQYDVMEPPFDDRVQMSSYQFSTSIVPSSEGIHPVECKPGTNVLSVMKIDHDDDLIPAGDRQFYDRGVFSVYSEGQGSVYDMGEIWVSYDVTLMKPRIPRGYGVMTGVWSATLVNSTWRLHERTSVFLPVEFWDNGDGKVWLNLRRAGRYIIEWVHSASAAYSADVAVAKSSSVIDYPGLWVDNTGAAITYLSSKNMNGTTGLIANYQMAYNVPYDEEWHDAGTIGDNWMTFTMPVTAGTRHMDQVSITLFPALGDLTTRQRPITRPRRDL